MAGASLRASDSEIGRQRSVFIRRARAGRSTWRQARLVPGTQGDAFAQTEVWAATLTVGASSTRPTVFGWEAAINGIPNDGPAPPDIPSADHNPDMHPSRIVQLTAPPAARTLLPSGVHGGSVHTRSSTEESAAELGGVAGYPLGRKSCR